MLTVLSANERRQKMKRSSVASSAFFVTDKPLNPLVSESDKRLRSLRVRSPPLSDRMSLSKSD